MRENMNVYHNGNGDIWGRHSHKNKLAAFPISKTFLWGTQEVTVPAVYIGNAGAVLDICTKIPLEDMIFFLKKWDKKRRLSLHTQEEYELIEFDNPASREFTVDMQLNGSPLTCRMGSSLRWYPSDIFQTEAPEEKIPNDREAENLMMAYSCDKSCCWHFMRLVYDWNKEQVFTPQNISLLFSARPLSVTTEHFTTDISCNIVKTTNSTFHGLSRCIKTAHPGTGQEYTLTLHGCEQTQTSFAKIGKKGVIYPEYSQVLSYSVSPEIDRDLLDIRDCSEGDHPRMADAPDKSSRSDGATAVFMAGKNPVLGRRAACSSLHFEPVTEVQWRIVFQVKNKEDIEISFPVGKPDTR